MMEISLLYAYKKRNHALFSQFVKKYFEYEVAHDSCCWFYINCKYNVKYLFEAKKLIKPYLFQSIAVSVPKLGNDDVKMINKYNEMSEKCLQESGIPKGMIKMKYINQSKSVRY